MKRVIKVNEKGLKFLSQKKKRKRKFKKDQKNNNPLMFFTVYHFLTIPGMKKHRLTSLEVQIGKK